jgi:hypothetical protein
LRGVRQAALFGAAAAVCGVIYDAYAKELTLSLDDLHAPAFSAAAVRATLSGPGLRQLDLELGRLAVAGYTWRNLKLRCPNLETAGMRIACSRGVLDTGEKIPVSFSYVRDSGEVTAEFKPSADEAVTVSGRLGGAGTVLHVKFTRASLARLAPWLPASAPKIKAGRASGEVQLRGAAVNAKLDIDGLAFADASGLHAGEKIAGALTADATGKGDDWRWTAQLAWRAGEVFWQPFFVTANKQALRAEGTTGKGLTELRGGVLEAPGIGTVAFNARWNHATREFESLDARGAGLRMSPLYEQVLKPLVEGTALADLRIEGTADVAVKRERSTVTAVDLQFDGISLEDRQRRFALFGVSGRIPWRGEQPSTGELTLKGGEVLKLPLGAARVPLRMRGLRVAVDSTRIPVLGGALQLRDFAAGTTDGSWRWRMSGELEPISMEQVSHALALPTMHGTISGVIPEMRYRKQVLAVDGALLVRVFDGTVTASGVELIEPFGRAPRLHANVEAKALDLELLTRTFDFGTMTGRMDATVRGLELVNWQPVRFDARLASSPGKYPRRISQRAVQNISALGGAGAAGAIQRSFLRFFDQFGYDKIGLSCRLANGVCEMDGVERAPQGYVIVKGGGIPAISVIGYNRNVNWTELVERLKRITQENVKPVVK